MIVAKDFNRNVNRSHFLNQIRLLIEKCPDVGTTKPQSIEINVVFPAPFGPNKPKIWPSFTESVKLSKEYISAFLYFFERDTILIIGSKIFI